MDIEKLIKVYGFDSDNWGDRPIFKGGYINYGYWANIPLSDNKSISVDERIKSSADLYRLVLERLEISEDNCVLEAGCGRGIGLIDIVTKMNVAKIIGLDINPAQIERTKQNFINRFNAIPNNVELLSTSAESTQLPTNSIDKIFSVECAQHFDSIPKFALEAKRILKPNGKLVFVTYFPTSNKYYEILKSLLPLIKEELENTMSIDDVCNSFSAANFKKIYCGSIGRHVFHGYEKWVTQTGIGNFSHNYYKAYQAGYIDYCLFVIE